MSQPVSVVDANNKNTYTRNRHKIAPADGHEAIRVAEAAVAEDGVEGVTLCGHRPHHDAAV